MTTPPLPDSSPAPAMELMEMSPLPHKPPYQRAVTCEATLTTPTVASSSNDSPMSATPSATPSRLQESPLEPNKGGLQE